MSFLTINGVPIPVALDTFVQDERVVGGTTFAQSGAAHVSRHAVKRDVSFQTTPMEATEAAALEAMIRGGGDGWDLATYYSAKGSPTVPANTAVVVGGAMSLPAKAPPFASADFQYGFATGSPWTVLAFRFQNAVLDGGYIIRSDGLKWIGGVSTGVATTWLAATAASALITGLNTPSPANNTTYRAVCAFPFLVPTSWVTNLYNEWNVRGAFAAPRLRVAGDVMYDPDALGPRTYLGAIDNVSTVVANLGGVRYKNLRRLSVKLLEV